MGKTSIKAVRKYKKNNYDSIGLTTIRKGGKEIIKKVADWRGESLTEFIKIAICERIEKLTGENVEDLI